MATSNNSLRVADLDFNSIRNNLKNYLRSQNTFTDYDFEGSGMSVLLDILAYNTYYNSFYLNMIANEAFLDTAQDRKNILSHAKLINYVPQSAHGSETLVNVTVTPAITENQTTNYIILDKYARLIGSDVNGRNYPFCTMGANTASRVNGVFTFSNVTIRQGEVITHEFSIDANNSLGLYQIPSANVDTDTIVVTVQESSTNTQTTQYFQAADITELRANSKVYFLEEDQDLYYTIRFGDNVLGQKPSNGNIVIVTYLDTVGTMANGIQKFAFVDPVAGLFRNNVKVTAAAGTYGGTDKEDIESIRFRAPYAYTAQNRAVTTHDYESLLLKDYPIIDAISVWGGEDNDPPIYGKVFISLKTKGFFALSNNEKQHIKETLITNRNVLTVVPEIVDPEYVFVQIRGSVNYDPNKTTMTGNQLLEIVKNAIYRYSSDELNNFNSTFVLSKLQNYIETSDPSITASDIVIYLQSRINIKPGSPDTYTVNFNTSLRKGDYLNKMFSYPQVTVNDASQTARQIFFEETPESFTSIDSISVINPGLNYSPYATVVITGDGTGATAEPVVINGKIRSINIINPGINYTQAVAVIVDEIGTQAVLRVNLKANYGILRAYYYKTTGEKVFTNLNAGVINYLSGQVTLTALNALNVVSNPFYGQNVLTFNAVPQQGIISPLRNRLLAIDNNNAQSIQIKMVPIS